MGPIWSQNSCVRKPGQAHLLPASLSKAMGGEVEINYLADPGAAIQKPFLFRFYFVFISLIEIELGQFLS